MADPTHTVDLAPIPEAPHVLGQHVMQWVDAINRWTEWLVAGGRREDTITLRRYQITRLAEQHTEISPWKITHDHLVAWLSHPGWGPETRRSYRAGIRTFYDWARKVGHIRKDPTELLPIVTAPIAVPRPTPEPVVAAALDGADDRTRLAVLLAAYAGLRRGEIAGLRWANISDITIVVTGKGGRSRVIPIHPALNAELAAERGRREVGGHGTGWRYTNGLDVYVFAGQAGGPMDPVQLGKLVSRALPPQWTTHTLRHRFASRAYDASRDLLALQELLGHSNPETTRRYVQTPAGAMRAAVLAI